MLVEIHVVFKFLRVTTAPGIHATNYFIITNPRTSALVKKLGRYFVNVSEIPYAYFL